MFLSVSTMAFFLLDAHFSRGLDDDPQVFGGLSGDVCFPNSPYCAVKNSHGFGG